MIIVIQKSLEFSLISEESHVIDIISVFTTFMKTISQTNESVMMFNVNIACQYSAIKDVNDYEIVLLY